MSYCTHPNVDIHSDYEIRNVVTSSNHKLLANTAKYDFAVFAEVRADPTYPTRKSNLKQTF